MIARGTVLGAHGGLIEARLPGAALGEGVSIHGARGVVRGAVAALRRDRVAIAPHGSLDGVVVGDMVYVDPAAVMLPLGTAALGRAVDARGDALDDGPALRGRAVRIGGEAFSPAERVAVQQPFWTGVKTIDALLAFGCGARIGLFGGPGAGKSTLLQMLAQGANADAVVLALIGERGREATEWMRACHRRTTIVCATSDRPAAERVRAARVAMAQAHVLRSRGLQVLVILDSFARLGAALRELAVANGESVGRGGYPPSVFADLAQLVEIAGNGRRGSITLVATVLSDGDDRDPLSDAARSLLDGHVQLSELLAAEGRFPAIDVLASTSRTMAAVISPEHLANARTLRTALAVLANTQDARALGIMPVQADALRALAAEETIERFLRQGRSAVPASETLAELAGLADILDETSWTSRAI